MPLARVLSTIAAIAAAAALLAAPASAAERPPVVLVVLDALPPLLLQDAQRQIDPVRFPHFAAFARDATWYRNATTIHESTRFSVPSIFDGRRPRPGLRETYADHPDSIFTLLGDSYRLNVQEEATKLCPPRLCPRHETGNVLRRLKYGRAARFRRTVRRISTGDEPQLTVIQALFPHEPRQFLPDGRQYQRGGTPDPAIDGPASYHRRFLTEQGLQRTILQAGFTDKLVGELVARLKAVGLYDDALVAFVSDHGESFDVAPRPVPPFQIGELSFHRAVTSRNVEDIAGVALFVKYPGRSDGQIDDRFVRTVDLFPTIAKAASLTPKPGVAGRDLRDPGYGGHADVAVQKQNGRVVSLPAARWRERVQASKANELALFGSGSQTLFDFGPARQLDGRRVEELDLRKLDVSILDAKEFSRVRLTGSFLPVHVIGRAKERVAGKTLAFALNGTVVATAPGYPPLGKGRFNFSAMLPPESFQDGANRLEVLEVR